MKNSAGLLWCRAGSPGSVLIAAIWILVVLTIFGAGLYRIASARIRMSQAVESGIVSYYLAKSAVNDAEAGLFINDKPAYDTLFSLSEEHDKSVGSGRFVYTVEDEERRIDVNQSPAEIIAGLPGLNSELAEAVVNSSLRPFAAKEELLLVEGISGEIFEGLKDFVSVYSGGKVNINTAPAEVLTALGIEKSLAAAIVEFRKGADGKEGTSDDEVFESPSEVLGRLRSRVSFMTAQEQTLAAITDLLTAGSRYYRVKIKTYVFNKQAMNYEALIGKGSVLEWREH